MEGTLPILWNHDFTKPIGVVEAADGQLKFRFGEDIKITHEAMFQIFGDAGIKVTEMEMLEDGTRLIKAGELVEFSLCLGPPSK